MSLARGSTTKVGYSVSGSLYLYRRAGGIYFVRLCVPARLKRVVGKGEVHRSTGCRDLRLAKIVAAELVAQWHRSIERLHNMDITKLAAGSVKLLGDGYISLVEASQECGATPLDLAERLTASQLGLYVYAAGWRGWLTDNIWTDFDHDINRVSGEIDEVVIDGTRLGGIDAQQSYTGHLSIRFTEEVKEVLEEAAPSARLCQFLFWPSESRAFVCEMPGQVISLADIQVRRIDVTSTTRLLLEQLRVQSVPLRAIIDNQGEQATEPFSALCARYFEHNQDRWTKTDHRRRKLDHTRMFRELMGDLSTRSIVRKVMRDFAEKIKDVPSQRAKFAQEFDLNEPSFGELVELKRAHARPGLSEREQQKVLDTLSQIFEWAVNEGDMQVNPAAKLGGEVVRKGKVKRKKAHEQRQQLGPDDLQAIFSVEWFATGKGKRTAKGAYYTYRPHYYWLPLMAMYCGGRLNELCQLYLKDVVERDSIPCLDFNLTGDGKLDVDEHDASDAADKSLKNISSARVIPIPQLLIDLGFLEYVEKLKALGHARLFPELNFDAEKGYGKYAGKWFNDALLGKRLGIPRDGTKTFHSMRHNFATALGALQAEPNQKADLMGHTRKGSTSEVRYDKGTFSKLKELIDRVEHPHPKLHPFDVDEGIQALQDALKLKVTRVGKA